MDRYLREHGFFALLVVGVVLLLVGVLWQPLALLPGAVLALAGGLARPIEEVVLKDGRVKWQRDAYEKVAQKVQKTVESRITLDAVIAPSGTLDTKVIRGSGAVKAPRQSAQGQGTVVIPEPARLKITGHAPTVIVAPKSATEFADAIVENIVEPALDATASALGASDVERPERGGPGEETPESTRSPS